MSKGTKIALIVVGLLLVIVFSIYSFYTKTYNTLVLLDEQVNSQWGQVENVYQRRYDLIPNLVATVKGYASHESEVLTQITEARSKAGGVLNISDEILSDPEAFNRFQKVQSELGGALQRLLMVTENYPDLKANQNFLALQDQLEGTENRISVERKRYNDVVKSYNVYSRQFPQKLIAAQYGYEQKSYFTASEGAQEAPKVSF